MSFLNIILLSAVVGVVGTGAGGLIVSLRGNPSRKLLSLFLGYSGGVMVSLVAFDLMPEAIELGGTVLPLAFMVVGAVTIMIFDMLLPHSHHFSCDEESSRFARTAYVVAMGIAMHDLPEGLAVGAGLASGSSLGFRVAALMFLHNMPEGMAVAGPLACIGRKRSNIILISALTGLPSVVGAAIGALFGTLSPEVLSASLAFAAGAMLFVTFDEVIPDAEELSEGGHSGTLGAVAGVMTSIVLSQLLH
ncbi:MAG: ZIP family metal transporter [Bacillota bacterium]|jgi:ZIP family zinc transporter|nr:ZIP family metal transporter [Candidatus Fermentithermobacillaceae bacterium]